MVNKGKKSYNQPKIKVKKINLNSFFSRRNDAYWGDWEVVQILATKSDLRLKQNIHLMKVKDVLNKINKLHVVSFEWNEKAKKYNLPQNKSNIGFIAQEIAEIFPTVVSMDKDKVREIDYVKLISILVLALQQLNVQHEDLTSRIDRLESLLSPLKKVN